MNDFLTLDTLFLLPTMIALCWGVVQLIKGTVDKALDNVATSRVVLVVALLLTLLKALYENQELQSLTFLNILMIIVLWIANAVVVWLAAMKAQEKFVEKQ